MHIFSLNVKYMHQKLITIFSLQGFNYFASVTSVFLNLSTYRTEAYHNQTLKANFSKTLRQKFKVKLYSDRTRPTL